MVFLDICSGMGLLDHTGVLYFGERELTGTKQLGINSSYWQVLVSFLGGLRVKNLPVTMETQEMWVRSWVGKIPWSGKWQPTQIFLPGKFHEQRSLMGYSPRGHRESDMTEHAYTEKSLGMI